MHARAVGFCTNFADSGKSWIELGQIWASSPCLCAQHLLKSPVPCDMYLSGFSGHPPLVGHAFCGIFCRLFRDATGQSWASLCIHSFMARFPSKARGVVGAVGPRRRRALLARRRGDAMEDVAFAMCLLNRGVGVRNYGHLYTEFIVNFHQAGRGVAPRSSAHHSYSRAQCQNTAVSQERTNVGRTLGTHAPATLGLWARDRGVRCHFGSRPDRPRDPSDQRKRRGLGCLLGQPCSTVCALLEAAPRC